MFKLFHNQITKEQINAVASGLSAGDRMEIEALGYDDYAKALSESIDHSETYTYITTKDGTPAAIAGVAPTGDMIGGVWLLTTDAVRTSPLSFVKQAKYWLARQKSQYIVLHNIADARNTDHLKLLKVLGFKRLSYVAAGPYNRTFVEFAKLI